jgi:hypothetical protein
MNQSAQDNKWQFNIPSQVKNTEVGGKSIIGYSFPINKAPIYNEETTNTVSLLNTNFPSSPAHYNSYILELYGAFLRVHSHRFAKNYTPAQLAKVTTNTLNTKHIDGPEDEEYNYKLTPLKVDIIGNKFIINWDVQAENVKIELVEEEEVDDEIKEVDVTELVISKEISESRDQTVTSKGDFLRRDSSSEAKKQLERAQLKVRIAKLKAERAIEKYVYRYGPIDPALLDSDSDNDNS